MNDFKVYKPLIICKRVYDVKAYNTNQMFVVLETESKIQ